MTLQRMQKIVHFINSRTVWEFSTWLGEKRAKHAIQAKEPNSKVLSNNCEETTRALSSDRPNGSLKERVALEFSEQIK